MGQGMWLPPISSASTRPACPFFRLLADPQAQALSLSEQRFCSATQQSLPDLAWQATYCLGSYQLCPHFQAVERPRGQPASAQLLEALVHQQIAKVSAPASQHVGVRNEKVSPRAVVHSLSGLLRRPLGTAVLTAALIGGLWAGIALADVLGQERPGTVSSQFPETNLAAYTLRTDRPTPTPTPLPLPAQLPGGPRLSVSRAVTPTATSEPRPTPTLSPTPRLTVSPSLTPTPTTVVSGLTSPVPKNNMTVGEASPGYLPTPTPTPVVAPLLTPIPSPSPRPTVLPEPTPTPTVLPTPTPDPWTALPPMARAGSPVPIATVAHLLGTMQAYSFAGNELAGAAPSSLGVAAEQGLPSTAGVLYGFESGFSVGKVWLNTSAERLVVVAEGITNPGSLTPILRIVINGLTVWEGTSPFPRGEWRTVAWIIDKPQLLAAPQLQVGLALATPGTIETEPWVALASVTVYVE